MNKIARAGIIILTLMSILAIAQGIINRNWAEVVWFAFGSIIGIWFLYFRVEESEIKKCIECGRRTINKPFCSVKCSHIYFNKDFKRRNMDVRV